MKVEDVFRGVMEFITIQWYFDIRNPEDAVVWDPQRYFLDFSALVASGSSGSVLKPNVYIRSVVGYLLEYYSQESDSTSQAMTQALETINGMPNLDTIVDFPSITDINTDSVTLKIPYSFDSSCTDTESSFLKNINNALKNFYRDNNGVYSIDGTPKTMELANCIQVGDTSSIQLNNIEIGKYVSCKVKMSFMMMLRKYNTSQGTTIDPFHGLSLNQFKSIVVGPSVPIPVCIDPDHCIQPMGCGDKDSFCNCLYYCAFGPYECPGYAYYYCQFYDKCKCVVTRAVPYNVALKDRVNNKFGQCFDLNCVDQTSQPSDCKDQCDVAKEWLSNSNWAEDFVNPAALDVDLIEKTCGFKVPQFSFKSNAYFWTWEVVVGGVCMLLTVPVLVAMESWRNQKFSLRFIHIVAFLCLVAMTVLFGYMTVGVQICSDTGIPNQSMCMDRLTQTIVMNHDDCDRTNPIFCQCDAKMQAMKPCDLLGTCKCMNNQLCIPGSGDADILEPAPATQKRLRWQLLYFCMGLFFLVVALVGVGLYYMTNQKGDVGWVPTIPLHLNIVIHIVVYVCLFSLIVIFPTSWKYVRDLDQTFQVNISKQSALCVPSS